MAVPPAKTFIDPQESPPVPVQTRSHYVAARSQQKPAFDGIYSWAGFMASVGGTIIAMAAVPENGAKQGMLILPSLGMAICLVIAPAMSGLLSLRNLLRTENIIALAPVYWMFLDLLQGNYELTGLGQTGIRRTYLAVGTFCSLYWLGTMGKQLKLPRQLHELGRKSLPTSVLFGIGFLMFVLGVCAFAIPSNFNIYAMVHALTLDRWSAPWARGQLGGWGAFIDHLSYFGYLLPTVAVMISIRRGWFHPATLLMTLFSVIFMVFLAHGGSRRIVGTCLGAAIVCWMLARPKIKVLHLFLSVLLVAAVLWIMQLMLVARQIGYQNVGGLAEYVTASLTGKIETKDSNLQVEDNFYRLAQTMEVIPRMHPYVNFDYIYYVSVRPIPRAIWKNKPVDGGFSVQQLVDQGASLSVSIIGELYTSYGFLAIAVGGWIVGKLTRLNAPFFTGNPLSFATALYGYMTMWLMVGFRSMAELILFSYPVWGLAVLSAILYRRKT